jgi:hypothetical protein
MASPAPPHRTAPGSDEPQRVCPHCATVSRTRADRCPWCRRGYRRRAGLVLAATAAISVLATVLAIAAFLTATADEIDRELSDDVTQIENRIDREVTRAQEEIEAEVRRLRRALPATTVP